MNSNVESGKYSEALSVAFEGISANDEVFYTLDNTPPNKESIKYDGAISLTNGNHVLRAAASRSNGIISAEAMYEYQIDIPADAFQIQNSDIEKNIIYNSTTILLNETSGLEITLTNYAEKCERTYYRENNTVNSIAFFISKKGSFSFNQDITLEDFWSDLVLECIAGTDYSIPEYSYLYIPEPYIPTPSRDDFTDYGTLLLLPSSYYDENKNDDDAVLRTEMVLVDSL